MINIANQMRDAVVFSCGFLLLLYHLLIFFFFFTLHLSLSFFCTFLVVGGTYDVVRSVIVSLF